MKEPKTEPKPINPDDWTDKQLSTIRRDAVQIALSNGKELAEAKAIYDFIKDGTLPEPKEVRPDNVSVAIETIKTGGWK